MLLALATLALVPGLLVVRAPWTSVPALSLAFWALSAWWPPLATASRGRVSLAALVVFVPLLLLRLLPKHEVPPPPGVPRRHSALPAPRPGLAPPPLRSLGSMLVAGAALAVALPGLAWRNGPGPESAFQTTAARVVLWRDGIPAGLEPLLPLAPFGAHAPALATLSADLARLAGSDPAPAVAGIVATAAAAALVGLFGLLATAAPPRAAPLGSLVGLALVPWPDRLSPWGAPDAILALAFLLPAVTLAGFHVSRSSAVAAGFLLAAGALAQPVLALVAALPAAVLALRSSPFAPASSQKTAGALAWSRRAAVHRLALVFGSALVFGLPGTRPFFQAISWAEATGGMLALRPADAAWSGAVFLAFVLGFALATRLTRAAPAVALGISLAAAVVLVARVHRWMAAGQLPPAEHYRLRRAALEAPALAPLCLPGAPPGDWIAAIAQRPPGERAPWIPPVYRDEWDARLVRPCVHWPR